MAAIEPMATSVFMKRAKVSRTKLPPKVSTSVAGISQTRIAAAAMRAIDSPLVSAIALPSRNTPIISATMAPTARRISGLPAAGWER